MGFGKAFLLSLTAFVGINFIFTIIYYALSPGLEFGDLFDTIQGAPLMILYYLFGSIICTPFTIFNWTIAQPYLGNFDLAFLILGLGYLIAPIIAAILAGRFGESKGQCFGGWLLTAVISIVPVFIGVFLSATFQTILSTTYFWGSLDVILISSIISCVINIVFYGFFALLFSKIEYY
ncbi:MAG: hypothetical protein HWN81_02555 [Candidatus Lokiarchaeota archaeon]|nr:hypothetical protein [Candidatus Lokiarchaeota archaeon]